MGVNFIPCQTWGQNVALGCTDDPVPVKVSRAKPPKKDNGMKSQLVGQGTGMTDPFLLCEPRVPAREPNRKRPHNLDELSACRFTAGWLCGHLELEQARILVANWQAPRWALRHGRPISMTAGACVVGLAMLAARDSSYAGMPRPRNCILRLYRSVLFR